MMPFGNLGAAFAQQGEFLESNPFAGMIIEQRKREAEEKRRREEEEYRRVAEMAKARQTAAQLQNEANASGFPGVDASHQPPTEDPLAQVNQQLATQNPTPEDLRQRYLRQAWGMQEGQQKPTFGQRTATILMEMVRGMAQGPNYRPIAERVQEEAQKDYALQTARMGQLNAAERINALTEKAQSLEAWQRQKFDEEMKFKQRQAENKFKVDSLNAITRDKTLDEKVRHNKQLEFMQAHNVRMDAMNTAAAMAGVGKTLKENEDGTFSFELDLSDPDKQEAFLKALAKVNATKSQSQDRTINTQQEIKIDTVDALGRKISKIIPIHKTTRVTYGQNEPPATVPTASPTAIPDVPAPTRESKLPANNPLSRAQTLQGIQLEFPNFTPDEHKALEGTRRTLVDINRSLSSATKEFRTWAEGGKKNYKGIGEFMQGTEINLPGLGPVDATRWAKTSALGQWAQRTFTSASDSKQQEKQARLDRIMKAYKEAQASAMFGDGGKNLTTTEKQLTKDYWSEPSEGPVAFYRGLLTTQAMVKLNEERLMRRITPSEEQSLSSDIADYVNSTVLKLSDSPSKVKDSDLDANVFLPRLMAKREALNKSAPLSNVPQPPVVKKEEKPSPTKTKSVLEYERRIKEEQEKKGIKTRGGTIFKRIN